MSATGSIPFAWLNVLPFGTLLQVKLAMRVEEMQMHNGVQQLAAVVGFASCDASKNLSVFIDERKQFVFVVHCFFVF